MEALPQRYLISCGQSGRLGPVGTDTLHRRSAQGGPMLEDDDRKTYRALSLGAGVQSSVLALLLSREDSALQKSGYPKPDCAVFADTGWEPSYVYEHLNWLESQLTFPLYRVQSGNLRENVKKAVTVSGHQFVDVPLFLVNPDGTKGSLWRQCTNHYKIQPIHREIRRRAGGIPRKPFPAHIHVEMWLGISVDEISRMKPSRERWVEHQWPLIDIGWSRSDCQRWFAEEYPGRVLPRSACVICPYHSDQSWLDMKHHDPESYEEAVSFDKWLRKSAVNPVRRTIEGRPYLHASRQPLATAVADMERSGPRNGTTNQFNNECEGMCGV